MSQVVFVTFFSYGHKGWMPVSQVSQQKVKKFYINDHCKMQWCFSTYAGVNI